MSTTSAPTPTPSTGDSPLTTMWAPPNRGVYTYSFLGGMAFIGMIVLIFVIRAYSRRRRFAIRVQHALDSGRLDPGVVNEIRSLPSGALYFPRSAKSKKQKIRPLMYETYMGEPGSEDFGEPKGASELVENMDWRRIRPVAVSKLISKTPEVPTSTTDTAPERAPNFHFVTSPRPDPTTHSELPTVNINPTALPTPAALGSAETSPVSPSDPLALAVFIAMPSPSSRLSRAKLDGEDLLPDICFGVTRVDVVD